MSAPLDLSDHFVRQFEELARQSDALKSRLAELEGRLSASAAEETGWEHRFRELERRFQAEVALGRERAAAPAPRPDPVLEESVRALRDENQRLQKQVEKLENDNYWLREKLEAFE